MFGLEHARGVKELRGIRMMIPSATGHLKYLSKIQRK
jgi:hypothetical protein